MPAGPKRARSDHPEEAKEVRQQITGAGGSRNHPSGAEQAQASRDDMSTDLRTDADEVRYYTHFMISMVLSTGCKGVPPPLRFVLIVRVQAPWQVVNGRRTKEWQKLSKNLEK